jgi:type IV pilus assembly protein PilE
MVPPSVSAFARKVRGFTLIELMIVVAIIAVLAAIGYPSYADYVRQGRMVEAQGELAALRVRLEQYYQDNRNYGSSASACGVSMPGLATFAFSCSWGAGATSQSFVAQATGTGVMEGYVFTVDDSNTRRTTRFEGATITAACWLKKRSESC